MSFRNLGLGFRVNANANFLFLEIPGVEHVTDNK